MLILYDFPCTFSPPKGTIMLKEELLTKCGNIIHINQKARRHLTAHPETADLLEEAVSLLALPTDSSGFCRQEVCMGRIVGKNSCIKTKPINGLMNATFAIRSGRNIASRVVVGVEKPDCDIMSILAFMRDDKWFLITAYVGPLAPREPHDASLRNNPKAFEEAMDFWCCHALVHDNSWSVPFAATWRQIVCNAHGKST